MGRTIEGPKYLEDGWTVTPRIDRFTGKQVGMFASKPVDPAVQMKVDKMFADARERRKNTFLGKLQKKVVEIFNLDTY